MRRMAARHQGYCEYCEDQIEPGDTIGWKSGKAAVHWECFRDMTDGGKRRTSRKAMRAQQRADDEAWRREIARESGMLHGIDAYNDAMGQSLEEPE